MVLSNRFAELSDDKFSFFSVGINSIDELDPGDREQIKKLKEDNEIVETPSLLFLSPQDLKVKCVYSGAENLDASLVVAKIALELE